MKSSFKIIKCIVGFKSKPPPPPHFLFLSSSVSSSRLVQRHCSQSLPSDPTPISSSLLLSVVDRWRRSNDPTALAALLILPPSTPRPRPQESSSSSNSDAPLLPLLPLATQLHAFSFKLGLLSLNHLLRVYSLSGALPLALDLFDEMPQRNLVSWTLLISAAIRAREFQLGIHLFLDMRRAGLIPNQFALASLLKASTTLVGMDMGSILLGSSIHCLAFKICMQNNIFVATSILHMYAKLGDIELAEQTFLQLDCLDTGCWNAMIGGYAECGRAFEAARIVCSMRSRGVAMDSFSFINLLKGFSVFENSDLFGREIHGVMIRSNIELATSVTNSLMDMYFKIGAKGYALRLFNAMHRDAVSWNTVFSNLSQAADTRRVTDLFRELLLMRQKPNGITFSTLFRLCGEALDLALGLQFYSLALQFGFLHEANVQSSIIAMFSKCGEVKMARLVFDSMPSREVITWNEMILGYNSNRCDAEALDIFCKLWGDPGVKVDEYTFSKILEVCSTPENQLIGRQIHGLIVKTGFGTSNFVCSGLIKCYVRFGLVEDSFEFLNVSETLDSASWGTMFSELAHRGHSSNEAMKLLNRLLLGNSNGTLDEFILCSILNVCAGVAVHHQTKSVHSVVIKRGFEAHPFVTNAAIDAYSKCGHLESAKLVFEESSSRSSNDVVLFNSMITAYTHHGFIAEAMEIFDKIKSAELQPSQASFVSVLSACNHLGLVEQGCEIFESISSCYGMQASSDVYGCLVDMLSRSGRLREAELVIRGMPYPPWVAIWRSLLNGCRIHGNQELGEIAAEELVALVPENEAAYVLLSKAYSQNGEWESCAKLRRGMVERGVRKDPGCSWIELNCSSM